MSKSHDAEKRELKFNEQIIAFGFDADGEYTHGEQEFMEFSRHAKKVLEQRALLDAD